MKELILIFSQEREVVGPGLQQIIIIIKSPDKRADSGSQSNVVGNMVI